MTKKDLYEVLGLTKSATQEEIKKAYKKKIIMYHPDKNRDKPEEERLHADEMAKSVNDAYATLSDPEKRKLYDIGGMDAVNQGEHHHGHHGGGNVMEQLFRQATGGGGRQMRPEDRNDFDIFHGYQNTKVPMEKISLKKLFTGTTVEQKFTRASFCVKCNGSKTLDKNPKKCRKCDGIGSMRFQHPMFGMVAGPCDKCHQSGLDESVEKCKKCKGMGIYDEEVTLSVKVPVGAHDGFPILVDNEGNVIPKKEDVQKYSQERANVVFIVKEKDHKLFKRDKSILPPEQHENYFSDLVYQADISFTESIIGFEKNVEYLNGETLTIRHEKPVKQDSVFIVEGFGMPRTDDSKKIGDLFVKINILPLKLEKELSSGDKQKICQLLGDEYKPLTSTKSNKMIPIEKKFKVEEEDDEEPEERQEMFGAQRVVMQQGQCPVQ